MKKIIIFLIILIATILLSSCSTQQRIVNSGCNCPTNRYDSWNTYSQGGWGNQFWGWNNNPFWGWNDPFWGWNNMMWGGGILPRYYIQPNRIQPQQPTRYERRGGRVSVPQRGGSTGEDSMYPQRTPNVINRSDYNSQPANRNTTPSRIQSNPTRTESPTRSAYPSAYPQQRIQSTPSRTTQPTYRTPSNNTTSPSRVGRGGN